MKRLIITIIIFAWSMTLAGCGTTQNHAQIAATTTPVYSFTSQLCTGTGIEVTKLVTENVSCLHDYSLKVSQMRVIESADLVVISGAGIDNFLNDALPSDKKTIDASLGVPLLSGDHHHGDGHKDENTHKDTYDPHIWLSPTNAKIMSQTICQGLVEAYPQHKQQFERNLLELEARLNTLSEHAKAELSDLSGRDILTFHDGFVYMAKAFDLNIIHAIEEESGSEASAAELIEICRIIEDHQLNCIFTERNGSSAAASIIANQTGVSVYSLDMAMSGDDYFDAMYDNITTLKEALE